MKKDAFIGLLLMALSAAFFICSFDLPSEGGYVSPGDFPRFVSGGMFVLATILFFQSLAGMREQRSEQAENGTSDVTATRPFSQVLLESRDLFVFAVVCFAYTQLINSLGFIVATLGLLFLAVLLFGERRWYVVLLVPVLGTSIFYYLFRIIFKVPLPRFDLF